MKKKSVSGTARSRSFTIFTGYTTMPRKFNLRVTPCHTGIIIRYFKYYNNYSFWCIFSPLRLKPGYNVIIRILNWERSEWSCGFAITFFLFIFHYFSVNICSASWLPLINTLLRCFWWKLLYCGYFLLRSDFLALEFLWVTSVVNAE